MATKKPLNPDDIAALASYMASPADWGRIETMLDLDVDSAVER